MVCRWYKWVWIVGGGRCFTILHLWTWASRLSRIHRFADMPERQTVRISAFIPLRPWWNAYPPDCNCAIHPPPGDRSVRSRRKDRLLLILPVIPPCKLQPSQHHRRISPSGLMTGDHGQILVPRCRPVRLRLGRNHPSVAQAFFLSPSCPRFNWPRRRRLLPLLRHNTLGDRVGPHKLCLGKQNKTSLLWQAETSGDTKNHLLFDVCGGLEAQLQSKQ